MTRPVLSNTAARRVFLSRHGLAAAPTGNAKGADLAALIQDLGFVQVDSVNTLARAHDLILWSRRQTYRPEALSRLLHRDRAVFEHWTHDASVIPVEYFPHWRHRFARDAERLGPRWREWQGSGFEDRFDTVLKRISDHGECMSADLADGESRGSTGWWDWHPSKTALEYLWRTGAISVVRRDGFRKVYDLTERVIPGHLLARNHASHETIDWACNAALDRLGFATSGELSAFFALATPDEAKDWTRTAFSRGEIVEIEVEDTTGTRRRSFARPGLVEETANLPEPVDRLRLLSPFDPALRDRNRAERLFGFFYRIEIFVPEPKRRYGYYVFPVMEGDRLIGRVDVKTVRPPKGTPHLFVRAFWPEQGITMGKGRITRLVAELDRATRLADLEGVLWADDWLRPSETA
ncbi:MAG: winged helix DNA-binding domain-containing protein [Rhodobacterales bacterium]|nr:winged helix DNA-binding domain-containing protein [Rhodobacterales bacterium]